MDRLTLMKVVTLNARTLHQMVATSVSAKNINTTPRVLTILLRCRLISGKHSLVIFQNQRQRALKCTFIQLAKSFMRMSAPTNGKHASMVVTTKGKGTTTPIMFHKKQVLSQNFP